MSTTAELEPAAGARVVAVMAKPLVRGAVKSRLAAGIGAGEALAVYRRLLAATLDQAERVSGVELVLAQAGSTTAQSPPDPLAGRGGRWRQLAQRGDSLGARLSGVFADIFAGGAEAVVAIDSDSPAIPEHYIRQAFVRLRCRRLAGGAPSDRLVLGPAADGGYYLIALCRETWREREAAIARLLTSSPMSSPGVLSHTVRGSRALGLEATLLPLWLDIDEPRDLGVLDRLDGNSPLRGEPLRDLREIYLHVTHRCGRACRHCYDRGTQADPGELTTEEWIAAIEQGAALGARSFVFIGGDPLLRDDLVDLVDHVTGACAAKARFFFNCRLDGEAAAALARAGRGRLTPLVSIDGPREINDELRGPGSYDDAMASVAELLAIGLTPVANTVLVRPALAGLSQLARELRAAGISRLHLILPHQAGGLPDDLDLVPSGDELLASVRNLLGTAAEIGLLVDNVPSWRRRLGSRNDLCAAGCRDLAIDPYGNVHACVITAGDPAFVAGSLREQTLEEIWRASSSLRLLRATRARDRAECAECPVVDACGGECWVQAHYAARAHEQPAGYGAPFPYCDLVRPMFEELMAANGEANAAAGPAAAPAGDCVAAGACGGQAAAGATDYSLFDCI